MDRRDFLAAFFQALLMAIFPSLRTQPELSKKLGFAIALRQSVDCPVWNMPVIEQVRWTIGGPLEDEGPLPTEFIDALGPKLFG